MRNLCRSHFSVGIVLAAVMSASELSAQSPSETPYAAQRLIGRWRMVMNNALEESRAFASEEVLDLLEEFVSPGAVRAVQDKAQEEQLKKADATLENLVAAIMKTATRQPDGSRLVQPSDLPPAEDAVCPAYPFCDK